MQKVRGERGKGNGKRTGLVKYTYFASSPIVSVYLCFGLLCFSSSLSLSSSVYDKVLYINCNTLSLTSVLSVSLSRLPCAVFENLYSPCSAASLNGPPVSDLSLCLSVFRSLSSSLLSHCIDDQQKREDKQEEEERHMQP